MRRRRRGPGTGRRRVAAARSASGAEPGRGRRGSRAPAAWRPAPLLPAWGSRPSVLPRRPPPLGLPRSRGRAPGVALELGALIHSFSADWSLRPAALRREEGRGGSRECRAGRGPGSIVLGGGGRAGAEGGGLGPPPSALRCALRPQPAASLEMAPCVLGRMNRSCPAFSSSSPPPLCSES